MENLQNTTSASAYVLFFAAMHSIIKTPLLFLIFHFFINAFAWSADFNAFVTKGAQRISDINNAGQTDTGRACTLNKWYTSRGKPNKPRPGLRRTITNNQLAISTTDANLNPISVSYGNGDPTVNPAADAKAKFDCTYDPTDGAIVYLDIFSSPAFTSASSPDYMSSADATWAVYQGAKDDLDGKSPTDYTNIRYLIHTNVQSTGAAGMFEEIWNAQPEDQRAPMSFTDQSSDQFKAVMGLDNGAVTAGLLRFHNQSMGKKKMKSVNVYLNDDQWDIWWELE